MKTKYLKEFIFDYAQYLVSDDLGNEGVLKVDYVNDRYSIRLAKLNVSRVSRNRFKQETANIAKDLLKRKHRVNFAEKELV